jgi:hypothetical protein
VSYNSMLCGPRSDDNDRASVRLSLPEALCCIFWSQQAVPHETTDRKRPRTNNIAAHTTRQSPQMCTHNTANTRHATHTRKTSHEAAAPPHYTRETPHHSRTYRVDMVQHPARHRPRSTYFLSSCGVPFRSHTFAPICISGRRSSTFWSRARLGVAAVHCSSACETTFVRHTVCTGHEPRSKDTKAHESSA